MCSARLDFDLEHQGVHLIGPPWRSFPDGLASAAAGTHTRRPTSSNACLPVLPNKKAITMKQEMLINVSQPEECRIAIVEDGVLEELYVERAGQDNYVGNIYKGVVVNLEPSIQAAFVDFGVGRNGFLHISDVEPQYFRQGGYDPDQPIGPGVPATMRRGPAAANDAVATRSMTTVRRRTGRRGSAYRPGGRPRVKPPIQDILRRGDELLVQVIKEGIGTKGPTLSTYISIPGRYLVLMPALGRIGVSRKIEDEEVRRRLRDIMLELNPPSGVGFIVRTAGTDRTKKELSRDLAYLLRLWKVIVRRIKKLPAPVDIYEESDMIIRTIRDIFNADVDTIFIDEKSAYERATGPLATAGSSRSEVSRTVSAKVSLKSGAVPIRPLFPFAACFHC